MCIGHLQTSFVQDDVKYYFLTRENELIILFLSYRQAKSASLSGRHLNANGVEWRAKNILRLKLCLLCRLHIAFLLALIFSLPLSFNRLPRRQ